MRGLRRAIATGAAVAALGAPGGASAAITSSHIATPSTDPTYLFVDQDATNPAMHVDGTTVGAGSGDTVDIKCIGAAGGPTVLKENVPVTSNAFSVDDAATIGLTRPCVLRAVPTGDSSVDRPFATSSWTGPVIMPGFRNTYRRDGTSGPITEFNGYTTKPHGIWDEWGAGSCAISYSYVVDPSTLGVSEGIHYCNAWFSNTNSDETGSPGTRSQLVVDGKNAYLGNGMDSVNHTAPHFPSMSAVPSYNSANGDLTIHEIEPVVRCVSGNPYPADSTNCPDFDDTGVQVDTWITDVGSGDTATVIQRISSTDGGTHPIDALFDQEFQHPTKNGGLRFPWVDSGYRPYAVGDDVMPPPGGSGSMYGKVDVGEADGTLGGAQGSVTWAAAPETIHFLVGTASTNEYSDFETGYHRTVGPSSPAWFGWGFAIGTTPSGIAALAHDQEVSFTPRITMSAPPTTSASTVHVTGTSGDGSGDPVSVAVNGTPGTVAGDGSWSTDVPVAVGANTLTATATNRYGATQSASASVSRSATPGGPPAHVFPGARFRGTHTLRLDRHGNVIVPVSCPAGSAAACTGKLALVSDPVVAAAAKRKRLRLGSKSFRVAAGKTKKIKIHVSRKGRKTIATRHKLRAKLTITSKDASAAAAPKTIRLTLRPARRRR